MGPWLILPGYDCNLLTYHELLAGVSVRAGLKPY